MTLDCLYDDCPNMNAHFSPHCAGGRGLHIRNQKKKKTNEKNNHFELLASFSSFDILLGICFSSKFSINSAALS